MPGSVELSCLPSWERNPAFLGRLQSVAFYELFSVLCSYAFFQRKISHYDRRRATISDWLDPYIPAVALVFVARAFTTKFAAQRRCAPVSVSSPANLVSCCRKRVAKDDSSWACGPLPRSDQQPWLCFHLPRCVLVLRPVLGKPGVGRDSRPPSCRLPIGKPGLWPGWDRSGDAWVAIATDVPRAAPPNRC